MSFSMTAGPSFNHFEIDRDARAAYQAFLEDENCPRGHTGLGGKSPKARVSVDPGKYS